MRKSVLFIAMSLDGYIADKHGGVSWLSGQNPALESQDAYAQFVQGVDTVVMGWTTYHQVATELSPCKWVYSALTSYVITHREIASTKQIRFVDESPGDLVRRLKKEPGKDIWICGGANIVHQLLQENLIDLFFISVIPTILGSGTRLFGSLDRELKLNLIRTQSFNGITELVYEMRDNASGGADET